MVVFAWLEKLERVGDNSWKILEGPNKEYTKKKDTNKDESK